jgi:hypothetical protein
VLSQFFDRTAVKLVQDFRDDAENGDISADVVGKFGDRFGMARAL